MFLQLKFYLKISPKNTHLERAALSSKLLIKVKWLVIKMIALFMILIGRSFPFSPSPLSQSQVVNEMLHNYLLFILRLWLLSDVN
jgi:hypothetical protein